VMDDDDSLMYLCAVECENIKSLNYCTRGVKGSFCQRII
jgi:hypothetical protein